MQPSDEEFIEWRQNPVTEYVLDLMTRWAAQQKAVWADLAWKESQVDPLLLREARTRADCYLAIPEMSIEDWRAIEERMSDTEA